MVSRAKRASKTASELRAIVEQLRGLAEDLRDEPTPDEIREIAEKIFAIKEIDYSEVTELMDEMQSWRDGLEGTNLEYSEKFERITDAADVLEEIESELSIIEIPGVNKENWLKKVINNPDPDESGDELEEIADTIEEQADELESVDFPAMFG